MSLSSAISTALSGLNASQAGLDLVSRNIANANTAGYTRKVQQTTTQMAGSQGIGVSQLADTRLVNRHLLQQMRTESASTSFLSVYNNFLSQIDSSFGTPDSDSSISGAVSTFATKMQAVATTPDDDAARQALINSASTLASKLNSASTQVQNLRKQAEQSIADGVTQANSLMQSIAKLNTQIAQTKASGQSTGDLEDQRDAAINSLSNLMGVKTVERDDGTVAVFTTGGQLLVDNAAAQLSFDQHANLDAGSAYSTDPTKRSVGTITLSQGTTSVDLIASGAIQSGSIAAYIKLRDTDLPQAQNQLDELASQLALSLSSDTVSGTAVSSGGGAGFELDLSAFVSGNTTGATGTQVNFSYTDGTGTHNVSVVPVSDPSLLPLPNSATTNANDTVVGVYIDPNASASAQMASIVSALQAVLPPSLVVSNPSGNVLSIVDDGTSSATVNSASTNVVENADTLKDGLGSGLSLFVDGNGQKTYTGALGTPSQITGFAGRIQVNAAIANDTTSLVLYQTGADIGDDTRPNELLGRLTDTSRVYSSSTGIGSAATPYSGSIDAFARRVVSYQSSQATSANTDYTAQKATSDTLQSKFDSETGVSVDQEMSNLIVLQNAYAANARVISTIQELFQTLLSIGR
ncbi:flagellar hook-associated protein FlgK [Parvibaculum sp.]|uniref:flagellar hook-associated protein FlgK n=1 Tax=Parvibaculum sp. TaxID=2024848 RepID=UPI00320EFC8C